MFNGQDDDYRDALMEATALLVQVERWLFTAMINTGMTGVYRELHQAFEPGDVYEFELAHFEDTGDANLDLLVDVLKQTAAARISLINLNTLPEPENDDETW